MSGLAELLLAQGCRVSGSDLHEGPALSRLRALGASVFVGHRAEQIEGAEAVVVSSAIQPDNPELMAARSAAIPVLHRSTLLGELIRYRPSIAVAGTHGKTTTTALIATILKKGGLDPTVYAGARLGDEPSSVRSGRGPVVVLEVDESDRSLLSLRPIHAVVTNIELDHTDCYRDQEEVEKTFEGFLRQLPFYGRTFACNDDPGARAVIKKVHQRVITYGLSGGVDYSAVNIRFGSFSVAYELKSAAETLGEVRLPLGGRHNLLNSLAAAAVGHTLGIAFEKIKAGLEGFRAPQRRLEHKGERKGVLVLDDYAHHPTEVTATLGACRATGRPVRLVFQPHRYSRTRRFMDDFARSFEGAGKVYLVDIYSAGEKPIPGVSSRELRQRVEQQTPCEYFQDPVRLVDRLVEESRPGEILITMGAGDVWKVGEMFLER